MLETITWKQYLVGVAALSIFWYIAIILIYFRDEIRAFARPRTAGNDPVGELNDLADEIRHSIFEKAGKEATKQELLQQLGKRLANYGGLRLPAYRYALNNRLIPDAEEICGVGFEDEELNEVWDSLPR